MEDSYIMLHQQFRTLISLTQIVSAINNDGHPMLRSPYDNKTNITLDGQVLADVVDAVANILVRNEEVVAVAFSGATLVAMHGQEMEVATSGESDSANAKQSTELSLGPETQFSLKAWLTVMS
jgi:hypothetical protein